MPRLWMGLWVSLLFLGAGPFDEETTLERPSSPFEVGEPVVCLEIRGYSDYTKRDNTRFTADEKLLIYIEPLNYTISRDDAKPQFRAHLSQTGTLRRAGKGGVLGSAKVVDYQPKSKTPLGPLYLSTTVSLKGLRPGSYELELTTVDALAPQVKGSKDGRATQIVTFEVVASSEERRSDGRS